MCHHTTLGNFWPLLDSGWSVTCFFGATVHLNRLWAINVHRSPLKNRQLLQQQCPKHYTYTAVSEQSNDTANVRIFQQKLPRECRQLARHHVACERFRRRSANLAIFQSPLNVDCRPLWTVSTVSCSLYSRSGNNYTTRQPQPSTVLELTFYVQLDTK